MIYSVFVREQPDTRSTSFIEHVFTFNRKSDADDCIRYFHHHWYDEPGDYDDDALISLFDVDDTVIEHDDISSVPDVYGSVYDVDEHTFAPASFTR